MSVLGGEKLKYVIVKGNLDGTSVRVKVLRDFS